jgi:hypothetical protein
METANTSGPPEEVYSSKKASEVSITLDTGRTPWWVAMMTGVFCAALGVLGLVMLVHPPSSGPPPMTWMVIAAVMFPMGAGSIYFGIKWKAAPLDSQPQALESFSVYPWGLIHQCWSKQVTYRWEDLTEVYLQKSGLLHFYRVAAGTGAGFQVGSHIQGASDLALHIQTKVGERLLPEYRRRLAHGNEVAFGHIHLSKSHLVYKGKRVPWNEFQSVYIEKNVFDPNQLDYVSVKADLPGPGDDSGKVLYFTARRFGKAGEIFPYCHVRLDSIPNFRLFAQLLEEMPVRPHALA